MPTVLNAANEVAVGAFLDGGIRLSDVAEINAAAMRAHQNIEGPDLATIVRVDNETRARVYSDLPASVTVAAI
jgi:1-deoxy-D-xylulose-5-phosphate reductoisomerase